MTGEGSLSPDRAGFCQGVAQSGRVSRREREGRGVVARHPDKALLMSSWRKEPRLHKREVVCATDRVGFDTCRRHQVSRFSQGVAP
jgi:hypothetical protein